MFTILICKKKPLEKDPKLMKTKKEPYEDKRFLRDAILLCGIIIIIFSCIFVFSVMDDDESWTENSYTRQRILLIGGVMFIASTGLCLYVMKTDKKESIEELELLIVQKPPSYDSVVFCDPPPAYFAVVGKIHVIQQEMTG